MRIKPQQILVAIGSLVITLGVLFGLQTLLQQRMVNDPLEQFYRHAPGVQKFDIVNQNGTTVVNITLGKVSDLQEAYTALENKTASFLPVGTFRLNLKGHRDATLTAAYNQMGLAIQQAIATGQFMSMEKVLTAEGKAYGLTGVSVQVDDYNVYLELSHKNAYLYAVIPRFPPKDQVLLLGGGG